MRSSGMLLVYPRLFVQRLAPAHRHSNLVCFATEFRLDTDPLSVDVKETEGVNLVHRTRNPRRDSHRKRGTSQG